jgi:hypothetical protein
MKYYSLVIVLFVSILFSCQNSNYKASKTFRVMDSLENIGNQPPPKDTATSHKILPQPAVKQITRKRPFPHFSVKDSMHKYKGSDTLVSVDSMSFYVGKANGIDFEVTPVNDSTYSFYQRIDGQMTYIDKFTIGKDYTSQIMKVELADNDKGTSKEIHITFYQIGLTGSGWQIVYLFNKKKKLFKRSNTYIYLVSESDAIS